MEQRQWISRALEGDRTARAHLFEESIQPIYYLCWKLTGSAAQAGIKAGDVIIEIDGDDITGVDDYNKKIASLKKGSHITVIVWRAGSTYACDLSV